MKKPIFGGKLSLLSVIMAAALLFLAGVLVYSAVRQFMDGRWFSGCVSVLGVCLVAVSSWILGTDMKKKVEKQEEDKHD